MSKPVSVVQSLPDLKSPQAGFNKPPLWLLAELTYRCPLHCVFCYNPVDYARQNQELDTATWMRVLEQARELGAAQLGFSGGEPLLRDDLEDLIGHARSLGYYTNLITSGIGLTDKRLEQFKRLGLDHIQVSFQDATQAVNDALSDTKTFQKKLKIAQSVKAMGWPMVLNVVLHRLNLDHIEQIIELALGLGVEYLELANSQYYGWAFQNRAALMPTREQLRNAEAVVQRYREKLGPKGMKLLFVVPDYYEGTPKACMAGWGNVFLSVSPDGTALPCQAARQLPGFDFPNVREQDLRSIWYDSDAFRRYRGDEWMQEPCRTCEKRTQDFGGCRCQAYLITGDATQADPVCSKSPHHQTVVQWVEQAQASSTVQTAEPAQASAPVIWYRNDANSRKLIAMGDPTGGAGE